METNFKTAIAVTRIIFGLTTPQPAPVESPRRQPAPAKLTPRPAAPRACGKLRP